MSIQKNTILLLNLKKITITNIGYIGQHYHFRCEKNSDPDFRAKNFENCFIAQKIN
jgi:hypothetical protein